MQQGFRRDQLVTHVARKKDSQSVIHVFDAFVIDFLMVFAPVVVAQSDKRKTAPFLDADGFLYLPQNHQNSESHRQSHHQVRFILN